MIWPFRTCAYSLLSLNVSGLVSPPPLLASFRFTDGEYDVCMSPTSARTIWVHCRKVCEV